MENKKLSIIWLANFPYFTKDNNIKSGHPAPWLQMLSKELVSALDINLTILSTSSLTQNKIESFNYQGITFVFIKVPRGKLDVLTLFRFRINRVYNYLKKNIFQFDIIHVHGTESAFQVISDRFEKPKLITTQGIIHELIKHVGNKLSWEYFRWKIISYYEVKYIKKHKMFHCKTNWDYKIIQELNPTAHIVILPNMIRNQFLNMIINISIREKRILFIGGSSILKGFREVLSTYSKIKEHYKEYQLVIIGNIKEGVLLKELKKLNNISEQDIEFKGFCNAIEIRDEFLKAYCLLHPSHIDNSPNVVSEAQLAGLPIIATDVGGTSSLIENYKNGILSSLDPDDIYCKFKYLVNNKAEYNRISISAQKDAKCRHNVKLLIQKYSELYENVMKQV